jgi:hypothetical protein
LSQLSEINDLDKVTTLLYELTSEAFLLGVATASQRRYVFEALDAFAAHADSKALRSYYAVATLRNTLAGLLDRFLRSAALAGAPLRLEGAALEATLVRLADVQEAQLVQGHLRVTPQGLSNTYFELPWAAIRAPEGRSNGSTAPMPLPGVLAVVFHRGRAAFPGNPSAQTVLRHAGDRPARTSDTFPLFSASVYNAHINITRELPAR